MWASMLPVTVVQAPQPNMMPSGMTTMMSQGGYGDLSLAPVPAVWSAAQQPVPEQMSMECHQNAWSWWQVAPASCAMPSDMQTPAEADAGPRMQEMISTAGSRLPCGAGALRLRKKQPRTACENYNVDPMGIEDPDCEAPSSAAPCGESETEHARRLADSFLERFRRSEDRPAADGDARPQVLASFRRMAFADKASCRAAQVVLQEVSVKETVALAGSLRGHVRAAMGSMYANYVLQKVVEVVPLASSSFVAEELAGIGAETARHRYGCRILCRLLEFGSPQEPATKGLFEEVLQEVETLSRHSFGGYVVQHFLEFGSADHKRRVGEAVTRSLFANAAHKRGSRIVEAALQHCGEDVVRAMADELLASADQVINLAQNQFGCHVVKALLRNSEDDRKRIVEYLRPVKEQMRNAKYGKYVLAASSAGFIKDAVF